MCLEGEDVYISCAFDDSSDQYSYVGKVASICAMANTSPDEGYVQYRFGTPSYGIGSANIEMQYPKQKKPPEGIFKIYSSSHPDSLGVALRVAKGEYVYSFESLSSFGYKVVVRKHGQKVFDKKCTLPGQRYLVDGAYQGIKVVEHGESKMSGVNRCSSIGLSEAYKFIDAYGVKACLVYTQEGAQTLGVSSRGPDRISLYSAMSPDDLKFVYAFPYGGTEGKIIDAFFLPVGGRDEELLFVMYRIGAPKLWNSVSDIYGVSVFRREGDALLLDEKSTLFFDLRADTVDKQGRSTYVYPYKVKSSVEKAVGSPLFHSVISKNKIAGSILEKTFLYDGASESLLQNSHNTYLVKGDNVLVEDATAGWCKVSYQAKIKMITKWAQCKSINFSAS
jgi:hypothetical protein